MLKLNSTTTSLLVAALAAGAVALGVEHYRVLQQAERKMATITTAVPDARPVAKPVWTASAPGRVEPRGGEVRIGSQLPGKVVQVLVRMNDTVKAGDLLVRLNDDEPRAKMAGALAEVAVRKRERDEETTNQQVTPAQRRRNPEADAEQQLVLDRRKALDAVYDAQRRVAVAQLSFDDLLIKARTDGAVTAGDIELARKAIADASSAQSREQTTLKQVESNPKMPLPTRLELSLATARAELSLIETALERTRIRAPTDGTVLQVNTRAGETVTPSPEDVLVVFGDLSKVQVRAEVEERDVAKIRTGQTVLVRSDAYPGEEFTGKVERMAQALGAPRLAGKGPRRPMEQEVLQVLIDFDQAPRLLPGLRVDVFFKPDETVGRTDRTGIKPN